ncbi:MAG: GntR family transcriptional regulator [Hyphomicrobiaceae bacterium]|nr:GntR family transcriptional regulator [Hyphomicrobiaceae bacterium]
MPPKTAKQTEPVRRRGRGAQSVYEALREDILSLELRPSELLDEASLSERFGMSRSPIREALIRLSMEGLIVTLPNKSTLVAPLNIEEYPAYLDALNLIERVVARLAARLRTETDVQLIKERQADFLAALEKNDVAGMIETNRNFHMAVSDAAKNRYFSFLHARLLDDGRRMLHLYFRSFGGKVPHSVRRDHDLIIKAIEAGDEDLAEKCAHDHVIQVGDRFIGYLSSNNVLDFSLTPPK